MFKKVSFLLTLSLFLSVLASSAFAADVRVGLSSQAKSGTFTGVSVILRDGNGRGYACSGKQAVQARSSGQIVIGGVALKMPVTATGANLTWGGVAYRGAIQFVPSGSAFAVVNVVDMEDYLKGIMKIEINPAWNIEMVKAQAVIARTYALRNAGKHGSQGFDVCADSHCQNYRGINGEDPRGNQAVDSTRGQVLYYGNNVATIYYHSDCGGATADVSYVWGGDFPYLRPVAEPVAYKTPYSTWTVSLSQTQVATALAKMNVNVGQVRTLQPVKRDASGRVAQLRVVGSSGQATVTGHAFRMAIGPNVLRSTLFGIGSPPPVVNASLIARSQAAGAQPVVATPAPVVVQAAPIAPVSQPSGGNDLVSLSNQDIFTRNELMDMLLHPEKREEYLRIGLERMKGASQESSSQETPGTSSPSKKKKRPVKTPPAQVETPKTETPATTPMPTPTQSIPQTANVLVEDVSPSPAVGPTRGSFTFQGRGWGHGVGLSQWGAKALSEQGWSYERILGHYFPGTRISQ